MFWAQIFLSTYSVSLYRGLPSSKSENLIIAEEISAKVICLPIFPGLESSQIELICGIIYELSNRMN